MASELASQLKNDYIGFLLAFDLFVDSLILVDRLL